MEMNGLLEATALHTRRKVLRYLWNRILFRLRADVDGGDIRIMVDLGNN
jgi:hypothetical protein